MTVINAKAAALIPVEHYIDRDFARRELGTLWSRVWQVACREEEVADVGSYAEYTAGGRSVIIVRSGPAELKAFHNACPHRGTRLKKGCGVAAELRCPYHAWTWNLDGSCREIVDDYDFPGLALGDLNLPEVAVDTWAGFVFVSMSPDPEPLASFLGPLPELAAAYRLADTRITSWRQVTLPCNWKVPIDNFLESYHVFGLHPQQLLTTDDVNAVYEPLEIHSIQRVRTGVPSPRLGGTLTDEDVFAAAAELSESNGAFFGDTSENATAQFDPDAVGELPPGMTIRELKAASARDRLTAAGVDAGAYSDEQLIDDFAIGLFPNISIHMTIGNVFLFRTRPVGDDPGSCLADLIQLAFPHPGTERVRVTQVGDWRSASWGLTLTQDFGIFEEQMAGLRSRSLSGLRTSAYQEGRVRKLHEVIDQYVGWRP
jgi:phenylpropionate dioxygenase-like ring-hydroxylating dioxygenase large terminal subunit